MKKKYIMVLKKICAVVTTLCFVFTIVDNCAYAFVNTDTVQSKKQIFELQENDLNCLFSDKYGKIVSCNNNLSDTVVINIQDLHCDYSVQKNIAAMIEELSNKYKIDNVYVEGGIGNIDTTLFSNINSQYKQEILERLLKLGKLTGTEYYSALTGKTNLLKGVEQEDIYLNNIEYLKFIIKSKDEISSNLAKINKEIDFLKSKYLKSKNKKFDDLLKQYEKKQISQKKFINELFIYAKQNNISLKNYKNLQLYLNLFNYSDFVNNGKIKKELIEIFGYIKQSLSYSDYNQFIKLTSNFDNIYILKSIIYNFCNEKNINISKTYPNLYKFFILKEENIKCNPIELVKEERKLIDTIRTYLSETETELEIAFLSDFEQFYRGYLSASLTVAQWEYVKLGLNKFKDLYAKYSISNTVEQLETYSDKLNSFYDVNTARNEIFINNMHLNTNLIFDNKKYNNNISEIFSNAKKIIVLVAGGYHTDGINEILNKKSISNITITPNVSNSTQESKIKYEYLAQKQDMSVRQMIALSLISNATTKEQVLTIVSSLLTDKNLDGFNVNMLVQHLNQIFGTNVAVSLINDGKQLEFSFKDGSKQIIDVDEELAEIIEEQNKMTLSDDTFVRVTGTDLGKIVELVSKTAFTGTEIFAPQIYKISKDVCLFMVENRWYLGNGAVWEIANSEYNGQTLDGVEPVIYEYMPDFMQKALGSRQIAMDSAKQRTKFSQKIWSKIFALIISVALMFNLTGCNIENQTPTSVEPIPYSLSEIIDYTEEAKNTMAMFQSDIGYLAYLPSFMTLDEKNEWSNRDFYYVDGLVNTFDQANAAIVFLKMGDTEKAREILSDIVKYNCKGYEITRVSGRKETLYKIYKSNRESGEILGEIVWVGLAAVQYKLVTGSDEFDELIKSVDEYLDSRECVDGAGYYMGSSVMYFSAGGYSSSEHQLDIMAYLTLKSLLSDTEWEGLVPEHIVATILPKNTELNNATKEQLSQMVEQAKKENTDILYNACNAFYNNMYRNNAVVRGYNDYFLVLDTNSWGVQVLLMLQEYSPTIEVEENGSVVKKSVYEASGLSKIDLNSLLNTIENNFYVTDEEMKANLSNEDYQRFKGYHLYTWSKEKFVDGKLNWSFEWSMQVATAYYLMGNYEQAQLIFDDAQRFAKEIGLYNGLLPASNVNAIRNYSDYGWKIPKAPSFAATITSILLKYGIINTEPYISSPFFPVTDVNGNIPSSILPDTIKEINDLISNGIFSIKKAIKIVINNESFKSFFAPFSFIISHYQPKGAAILTLATILSFLVVFTMSMIFFYGSYALFWQILLALVTSFIVAFYVNIGTHAIMDYRYLKSIGLSEAIKMYGKDNVKLTETGLSIDNKEQNIPVYVINDKPKNAKEFNFKSVPVKIKVENGKIVKCWIGNYEGAIVIFADGAKYEDIVNEFSKTRKCETIYAKRTSLKANVDVIEVDMNNPDSNLRYSQKGNPIIGANILKTADRIDLAKEISLLKNKKIEAVTINQNIAIYIDDEIDTLSTSQDFVNVIDLYFKNENLGVDAKVLFSDKYIDRVLELLEKEQGNKELAQQKFIEIIKQLKDENKEIVVVFDENSAEPNFDEYKKYGIFSYIIGNEYVDGITATKSQAKFVTNLSQIACFDGSLSIIKVSLFRKEIEKASGIFTFLTSNLNLKEYIKNRSVNFIKQVANNFDYNQIPTIDVDLIAQILKSENKFENLRKYLNETDSILIYYLGLSGEEEKTAFIDTILGRILVVNYLRQYDNDDSCLGLKNKKMEKILAAALVAKYNKDGNFDVSGRIVLNENLSAAQFELEFEKMVMDKVATGFKDNLTGINDAQSIDDIIQLIPLYSERNVQLRTANVKLMSIQDVKGILSAA